MFKQEKVQHTKKLHVSIQMNEPFTKFSLFYLYLQFDVYKYRTNFSQVNCEYLRFDGFKRI